MPALPYKNVSFPVGSDLTTDKFNQMTNNDQWLFENMPKAVYNSGNVKKGNGIKILSGASPYPPNEHDWVTITVSFGNYFSVGSAPVVVATVGADTAGARKYVQLCGLSTFANIDHRGFYACVSNYEWLFDGGRDRNIARGGFVNWVAVGY